MQPPHGGVAMPYAFDTRWEFDQSYTIFVNVKFSVIVQHFNSFAILHVWGIHDAQRLDHRQRSNAM
jgi:hypothetical protein